MKSFLLSAVEARVVLEILDEYQESFDDELNPGASEENRVLRCLHERLGLALGSRKEKTS